MKLTANSLIYRGVADTPTANCCFPAIARTKDRRLLATWRVGSQKDSSDGALWLSCSVDEGLTWSPPREIISAGCRDGCRGEPHYGPITTLRDGRLLCAVMWVSRNESGKPLFNPATEGILPLRTLFYESLDDGKTWAECGEMDSTPYDAPLAITAPILELPNGALACQFEVNKDYEDLQPWRHAAAWKFSYDGGRTWPHYVEVASDASRRLMYWDMHAVVVSERQCMAAFWTFDRQKNCDRAIHLSLSDDLGQSWSSPRDLGIVGQIAEPVALGDNRLALIVVDRFATRSIRAVLSHDMGATFADKTIIYQQPGPIDSGKNAPTREYLQDMELWTFGRVQAVANSDDNVWVVYYAGDQQSTGIYCARLETSRNALS